MIDFNTSLTLLPSALIIKNERWGRFGSLPRQRTARYYYMSRLGRACLSDELGERGTAERSEESNESRSDTIMCGENLENFGNLENFVRQNGQQPISYLLILSAVCLSIYSSMFLRFLYILRCFSNLRQYCFSFHRAILSPCICFACSL